LGPAALQNMVHIFHSLEKVLILAYFDKNSLKMAYIRLLPNVFGCGYILANSHARV